MWYSYTVEVSECGIVILWKSQSVIVLNCESLIVLYIYTVKV